MAQAVATEDDFGIQYDDTIVCDVCREVRYYYMDAVIHLF